MSETRNRPLVQSTPQWLDHLSQRSGARLGLGRAGTGQPSVAHLKFGLDHARARDAVHSLLDVQGITSQLEAVGQIPTPVHSDAPNRQTYLRRPDMGRRLNAASLAALEAGATAPDIVIVIADGLSARAVNDHAAPLVSALAARLGGGFSLQCVVCAQGRVAVGDKIAMALGAKAVLMLIGERPGLSSADSLGAYLTFAPKADTHDANRNCISNIRPGGLDIELAAQKLKMLISAAFSAQLTGVGLRVEAALEAPEQGE